MLYSGPRRGAYRPSITLRISLSDWRWLILSVVIVLATEAGNTAIEQLCNLVHPARHPIVKRVKDLAAGSVLLRAIGTMTLWPYLQASSATATFLCGEMIR
jgi:diacylglycerol kinase